MEFFEIVSLQFALPILGVLCFVVLVFLFGFRAPIQPPVIAEDVVVALRKSKLKISSKHSKKVISNHLDTTSSEGAKLQVPVGSKLVVKKSTDKSAANSTAKVPVTVVPNKSKEENVVEKNAESLKENDWMLATTKKVKKDRMKQKQEHERNRSKVASTVLKESTINVAAAVKEHSAAVVEKSSLLATPSQNEVSLKVSGAAAMKQQKKAAEPEVSSPSPTQPKQAAQAVVTNVNGSVVKDKREVPITPQSSASSSSKVSEAVTAKTEKSDQSKKKGKTDKQPAAVTSLPVDQATSATTPNTKSEPTAAKETKKETAPAEERYHQVVSKLVPEPDQKNSGSKKSKKSQKAGKGTDDGSSNVAEGERENTVTGQQLNDEQVSANDLNSQEWEEIKAPKKKKKVRLD